MDNDADDLDDLFERRSSGDEDQAKENKSGNVSNTGEATAVPVPVRKRIVRNPRLKFNADRLCGDRGIPVLVDHFKNVKFKGKGHEKEDLEKLLATLEHWTHRLFPSMKFLDCLRQIEKLGKKRPVQTCLHKIRLDMPILSGDFVGDDEDKPKESGQSPEPEVEEVDPFDALISQNRYEEPVQQNLNTPLPSQNIGQVLGSSFGCNLTDEQRKRMEYNRMLATERRKAKLSAVQRSLSPDLQDSVNLAESTRNEKSLNETPCHDQSTDLSRDLFPSNSSLLLAPESESLLQSNDEIHSNKTQSSQVISYMSVDQNAIAISTSEKNLVSNKDPGSCAETLKTVEVPSTVSPTKNNFNDVNQLEVDEVLMTNDEMQFDVKYDSEVMDVDSVSSETEPVEKDVIFENNILSPKKQLSNTSLDTKLSDSPALSQSILEVTENLLSDSAIIDQSVNETPCSSSYINASKEDSDELKMDELMDLIDE